MYFVISLWVVFFISLLIYLCICFARVYLFLYFAMGFFPSLFSCFFTYLFISIVRYFFISVMVGSIYIYIYIVRLFFMLLFLYVCRSLCL